jgi:hypothetical protein
MTDTTVRPEPVLDEAVIAGKISAAATAVLGLAVVVGLVAADEVPNIVAALITIATGVATIVNYVVPKVRAYKARAKVTPLSSPQAADGTPLVKDVSF